MQIMIPTRVGNIVTPMRIKLKRNSKPVATAMTSNVPSPPNVRDRPGGSAEGLLHFECFLTAAHSDLSH